MVDLPKLVGPCGVSLRLLRLLELRCFVLDRELRFIEHECVGRVAPCTQSVIKLASNICPPAQMTCHQCRGRGESHGKSTGRWKAETSRAGV